VLQLLPFNPALFNALSNALFNAPPHPTGDDLHDLPPLFYWFNTTDLLTKLTLFLLVKLQVGIDKSTCGSRILFTPSRDRG
jgi:hypothetical protein